MLFVFHIVPKSVKVFELRLTNKQRKRLGNQRTYLVKILDKIEQSCIFVVDGEIRMIWLNNINALAQNARLLLFFRSYSKHDPTFSLLIGFKGNT